jgi:CTP synthase
VPRTRLAKVYGRAGTVKERHRHRYEFNNRYRKRFEKAGMVFSGLSPDGKLVEAIELPDHPFFIGTQFHPEYKSRPLSPHPIFVEFLNSVIKKLNESARVRKQTT